MAAAGKSRGMEEHGRALRSKHFQALGFLEWAGKIGGLGGGDSWVVQDGKPEMDWTRLGSVGSGWF